MNKFYFRKNIYVIILFFHFAFINSANPGIKTFKRDFVLEPVAFSTDEKFWEKDKHLQLSKKISIKQTRPIIALALNCKVKAQVRNSSKICLKVYSNKKRDNEDDGKSQRCSLPALSTDLENLIVYFPRVRNDEFWENNETRLDSQVLIKSSYPVSISNCRLNTIHDNVYTDGFSPLHTRHDIEKNTKRIIVMGHSTLDGSGFQMAPPYILQYLEDLEKPKKIEVMNLAISSASIVDDLFNWEKLQIAEFNHSLFHPENFNGFAQFGEKYFTHNNFRPPTFDYGIKDLQGDFFIVGPMWNSLLLKYFTLKKDVPAINQVPLPLLLMQEILTVSLTPTRSEKSNLEMYSKLLRKWVNGEKIQFKHLSFIPYQKALKQTYQGLVEALTLKILANKKEKKILFVSLPFALNKQTKVKQKKWRMSLYKGPGPYYQSGLDLDYWFLLEKIQSEVLNDLAKKYQQYFLNLSAEYHQIISSFKLSELENSNFFTDDLMHFSEEGNEFIAQKIFNKLQQLKI